MAEVMLLDHLFHPVSRGVAQVRAEVDPGMYLARAIAGNRAEEQAVVVRADAPAKVVELPMVRFDSPIPLADTRTMHEYQQAPVIQALNAPIAAGPENTGGFLLCVRDPSQSAVAAETKTVYEQAYQGFRLLDENGDTVLDYDAIPSALRLADRLLLHKADLPPASYQLEWKAVEGPAIRLPLIIRPDMTTQLYVLLARSGHGSTRWTPDMENAAMAYGWNARGFAADSPEMRLAERTRYCLTRGASLMTTPDMDEMLRAKFENPMLGLLAAHLLLLEKDPMFELIETIIRNTGDLLGDDFPDVVALRMRLASMVPASPGSRHLDIVPITVPPLLRRSWDYLVEATNRTPDLIPKDSFAYRVSRTVVSNGIWMAWRPERTFTVAPAPTDASKTTEKPGKVPARSRLSWGLGVAASLGAWARRAFGYLGSSKPTPGDDRDRLKQVLEKVLDGSETRELAAAGEKQCDPVERARDLVEYLVRNVAWDQVIRQLRRRESGSQLSASLSDLEKSLLPVLQSAKQHLEDGGELDRRFVEGMAKSLAVPIDVLLDGLADLARQLARIALGKARERTSDSDTAK